MKAEIIAVGTELLLGDILNTNAQFLSRQMAELGFTVHFQTVVGDNAARLAQALQLARSRSDVILLSGGLGPTEDDLTKQTAAKVFGDELVLNAEVMESIKQRFSGMHNANMTANNLRQAYVPLKGSYFANANGTAPGIMFSDGACTAYLMPGPPQELEPMFINSVKPLLLQGMQGTINSLVLHVYGIGESSLETLVKNLLEGENPTAALYAKRAEVSVRITAKAQTQPEAQKMCDELAAKFYAVVGDKIYGTSIDGNETLEQATVAALKSKKAGVATAESCTGGLLAQRITSVSGASEVFEFGAVTYADVSKKYALKVQAQTLGKFGAVSAETAAEMARGAAKRSGAQYGVAITGIAGPNGGTQQTPVGLVYIAVCDKQNVHIRRLNLKNQQRDAVRYSATQHALDMLRRLVLGLPLDDVKTFAQNEVVNLNKQGKPRRKAQVWPIILLVVVLAAAACGYGLRKELAGAYTKYVSPLFGTKSESYIVNDENYLTKMEELVAANADAAGILSINGENGIPLVRGDAEFYKTNNALKQPFDGGAALLEVGELDGANTVIYAKSGPAAPFEVLLNYKDAQFIAQNATAKLYTLQGIKQYKVLAAFYADDTQNTFGAFNFRATAFEDAQAYTAFAAGLMGRSLFHIGGADIIMGDGFLTLYTDDDFAAGGRFVVVLRRVRELEEVKQTTFAAQAPAPIMPQSYYSAKGLEAGDEQATFSFWLDWFMVNNYTNADLQALIGMPAKDFIIGEGPAQGSASSKGASSKASSAASSSKGASSAAGANSSKPPSSTAAPSAQSAQGASAGAGGQSQPTPSGTTLTVTMNGTVVTDSVENILSQIVAREMNANFEAEALKAQAVATHTWILNQQAGGNAAPAVLGRAADDKIKNAVASVAGEIMTVNGAPIYSPYFSLSAGRTNSSKEVWGSARSYLVSVESKHDSSVAGFKSTCTFTEQQIKDAVKAKLGIDLEGDPATWFEIKTHTDGGYVNEISIGGRTTYNNSLVKKETAITGRWVREDILAQNGMVLRSACFEIAYENGTFTFTTYGYGHGAGMSQWGAQLYAKNDGMTYRQILAHYYQGVSFSQV